ncbi:MAG: hypothetical protein U0169_25820 [Polyangiaceae bacterium]
MTSLPRVARLSIASLVVTLHVLAFMAYGREVALPWNNARDAEIAFVDENAPLYDFTLPHWNRLLPMRWDSIHYEAFALRGFSRCESQDLRNVDLPPILRRCGFHFYPGYPLVARALRSIVHVPVDIALLVVSVLASFGFVYLFTGRWLTAYLGVRRTVTSLVLFATFTTGFTTVTGQTEPLLLFLLLGAFACLERKLVFEGALLAGAATAIRVNGIAVGAAYFVGVCARDFVEAGGFRIPPKKLARAFLVGVVSLWGQLLISAYFARTYHDPLLYFHAHASAYDHSPELLPSSASFFDAITKGMQEGLFVLFGFFWLALGLRPALRAFPVPERAFWYTATFLLLGVSLVGSAGLAYAGMNRYWLAVLPLFFAIATVAEWRPSAVVLWTAFCLWHGWTVSLPVYVSKHTLLTKTSPFDDSSFFPRTVD